MKILFFVLILGVLLSCTVDQPLPGGDEILDRDERGGVMPPITLKPVETGRFWEAPVTGYSPSIVLGARDEFTSHVLININTLYALDSSAITQATLNLYSNQVYSENAHVEFTLYEITVDWEEATVDWETIKDGYDPNPIETMSATFSDTTWIELPFSNLNFISEWINDQKNEADVIKGLLLKCTANSPAVEFYSSDAGGSIPYVEFIYPDSSGEAQDTMDLALSQDASLLNVDHELNENQIVKGPDYLRIGNASGYKSLLRFDFSEIPESATIHQAFLTLHIDQSRGMTLKERGLSISATAVLNDSIWSDGSTVKKDSVFSMASDVAFIDNETFAIDSENGLTLLSHIVQRWTLDIRDNYGLLLMPNSAGRDFQELYFHSGKVDTAHAPTLEITYSLPPDHRFLAGGSE
ncbi:MAG: DNRLRE domain-containing protein [candidate division KSB1 bacterium]|nr:DNRLRE domain-containing protein [candidate division KSB1 bacterium]